MTETAKATDKGANLECATLSIPEAGRLVANLSVNGSYAAAARGEFGEILEFGRLRRVAKAPLLRRLGLGEPKAVETAVDDDSIETGVEERIQPAAETPNPPTLIEQILAQVEADGPEFLVPILAHPKCRAFFEQRLNHPHEQRSNPGLTNAVVTLATLAANGRDMARVVTAAAAVTRLIQAAGRKPHDIDIVFRGQRKKLR